jgi:hypothetical protein
MSSDQGQTPQCVIAALLRCQAARWLSRSNSARRAYLAAGSGDLREPRNPTLSIFVIAGQVLAGTRLAQPPSRDIIREPVEIEHGRVHGVTIA